MSGPRNPQIVASDPDVSAFVTANAGSGKTRTLVDRVARLLLRGARPEAILCVTFTKAAAAEMQRRLFQTLGDWAVMPDGPLAEALAAIEEAPANLARARALFASALDTPGGLKIQTIHAFCEKLLRRFPLEAGVSPAFTVIDESEARDLSARAREDVARAAQANAGGPLGSAYSRLAADLDFRAFNAMFGLFEAERDDLKAYLDACEGSGGVEADVWRRCGFSGPTPTAGIEAEALDRFDWEGLRAAARELAAGGVADAGVAAQILEVIARRDAGAVIAFDDLWACFSTQKGDPRKSMATKAVDPGAKAWLEAAQSRLEDVRGRLKAAAVAEDSIAALTLGAGYVGVYDALKGRRSGLDFGDLIDRAGDLLTRRTDAAWVLYKLDGGLDHILLDEAQDTSPGQWKIVDALADEFFSGAGAREDLDRTTFAVGDEKQSIFSFQGARPELFARKRRDYRARVEAAGGGFAMPELATSYRSAPEVLAFVDTVFADPEAKAGLKPDGDPAPVEHVAHRPWGHGGVEIWPLEFSDTAEEQDVWAPLDLPAPESGAKKLARRIAEAVKGSIAAGEAVFDKEERRMRPCGPQDFMVLVRRRNALFHEIIRALKKAGVPVGGADRLKLTEHIAYLDLVAAARFVLFPEDDLNLAALMRSPLFDVDEDSLFALARPRRGQLWPELRARAAERPEWTEALALLDWLRERGRACAPFDFYGRLLVRTGPDGRSMRARILTRLGAEAEDALEAFMAETLAAEGRGARDLETFAADMAASEIEVKREQEDGKGYVRVMTAHGAKGLEAPIVFLPDTTGLPPAKGAAMLRTADGGFLWCASASNDCPPTAEAREARKTAMLQESLRLLYVGLTRARDRLIVAGVAAGNRRTGFEDGSWWDHVGRAAADPPEGLTPRPVGEGERAVLRLGADPVRLPVEAADAVETIAAPAWLVSEPPAEPPAAAYASPSRLADEAPTRAPSPLARAQGLGRFRRGDLVHKLLQLLPDFPADARRDAAARMLAREADLSDAQRAEIAAAAFGVLEDARFAPVFGPGSRPEVALAGAAAGLPAGLRVSGRMDRLVVTPDRVLVIDFKSNRPSPDRIEDTAPAYIVQMAIYAAVLADLYPGRRIEAALVWTDGPKLMPVPESLIADALARLAGEG